METLKTGTTTLGMVCRDATIMAADQRSSMGYLVSSDVMEKLIKISDKIVMTIAGTAGDGQALARLMSAELKLYELQEGEIPIKAAATLLSTILRSSFKSFRPDMVQILIGGYDVTGPHLYSVDLAGATERATNYAFTGSGSPIAVGVLEDKYVEDMPVDDGIALICDAIRAAKKRDLATGGKSIDIAVITKDGVRLLKEEDVLKPGK
ncbi:MAG: proteasome subunit beta [archaeon]|nr:proteasome subunit beta [archaeon]